MGTLDKGRVWFRWATGDGQWELVARRVVVWLCVVMRGCVSAVDVKECECTSASNTGKPVKREDDRQVQQVNERLR